MPLDFPTSPTLNEIYTFGGRSWKWNGTAWDVYSATSVVNTLNGLTGTVGLSAGSNITVTSAGNTITISSSASGGGICGPYVISFNGLTGAVQGVSSFNGLTGSVQGVSSIRGLTGTVGFTNGSGISLSVSGNTLTVSNTGVLSIDGSTGAISNVARTNVNNNFSAPQTIAAAGAVFVIDDTLNSAGVTIDSVANDIIWRNGLNQSILDFNPQGQTVTLPNITTILAGLSGTQTFGGTKTFNALTTFNVGLSSAGGTFSGLVSSTVGFSGAATNLTGNATGLTAGTATRIIATATNSASTFYPTFVGGAGNTGLFIDPTIGPLSYIPSTATLKLTNLDVGNGALTLDATQVTASNFFYFIASNGIYFQDAILISMGDVGATAGKTLFEVYPTTGTRYACLYNSDFANNATLMVNRSTPVGTHAFEANRSDGKAVKLIYGDTGGAATNYVDLDVSSSGDLSITPSGGDVTVVGRLYANNIVNTLNGLSGGVTLAAGTNITLTPSGNTITIDSTSSGGGGSSIYSTTQTIDFSELVNQIELVIWGSGNDFGTTLRNIENNPPVTVVFDTGSALSYNCVLESIQSFYDDTNGWSARLIIKPPFTGGIGTTAEAIIAETINTVYINTATVGDVWSNIQSQTLFHQQETYTIKTITGITWITPNTFVDCKVLGLTTADHTAEDAILEQVSFEINNIVGGTGFDVIGHAPNGTYGKYSIKCQGS